MLRKPTSITFSFSRMSIVVGVETLNNQGADSIVTHDGSRHSGRLYNITNDSLTLKTRFLSSATGRRA